MNAGPAVRGGRPLVEHPLRRALATAEALVEDVVLVPPFEDARFERDQIDERRHRLERHVP
jgi:hypothetical protein